jgi:hypothetical protein
MTSHYTIAQYVPNPTADERMNIGIIVWDNARVYSSFINDFSRARSFGGKNVNFLKEFADYVSDLTKETSKDYREFSPSNINRLILSWTDSIQFTAPRGSTKSSPELIAELPARFLRLHEPLQVAKVSLTRSDAIRAAYQCVLDTVKVRAPKKARHLVRKNQSITGKYNSHSFDIALVNGSPFAAVNALSFGVANRVQLQKEIDATAWIFDDVRMSSHKLPLAVYIMRSDGDQDLFEKTERTFNGLRSMVVSDDKSLSQWADKNIRQKADELSLA